MNIALPWLDDLNDKDFYEKVNGEQFRNLTGNYDFGFVALDRQGRIAALEYNPERTRTVAVSLGCLYPRVLGMDEISKKFCKEHNKRLEAALSEN